MASAKLGLLIAAAVFPLAVAWSAFTDTSASGQKSRGIYMVLCLAAEVAALAPLLAAV